MVTLRPDSRAASGWSVIRTIMTPETSHGREIRVTEGFVKGTVVDYQVRRAAGLALFTSGGFTCDMETSDAATIT